MSKKKYKNQEKINWVLLAPVLFVIGIIPLMVRMKVFTHDLYLFSWFDHSSSYADFFNHYKSIFIVVAGVVSLLLLIYIKWFEEKKFKHHLILYPALGYLVFVLLSSLFSSYSTIVTKGYPQLFETLYVLFAYMIIFYYAFQSVNQEADLKMVLNFWMGSILIMSLLGITQFVGHDFIFTDFGKKIIVPTTYWHLLDNLSLTTPPGQIYQTLFHYNYVGFYLAMALPFFVVLLVLEKNIKRRLIYLGLVLLMFFSLIASQARGGLVGVAVAAIFILVFLRKALIKNWKITSIFISLALIAFIGVNTVTKGAFLSRISDMFITERIEYNLDSIVTNEDAVIISYKGKDMVIKQVTNHPDNFPYALLDANGNELSYIMENGTAVLTDSGLENISYGFISMDNDMLIEVMIDNTPWVFGHFNNSGFVYVNPFDKAEKLEDVATLGFEGRERMGSARGYIWSRSLPLIKDYIIIGSGPDTYPIVFPQHDYVGKYNAYGTPNMIVDKPHNVFLQTAIQTGLLSLLALLAFYIIYFVWSLKLYWKSSFDNLYSQVGIATLIGTIGFWAAGIFNDSNVSVSPIFWVLMGIGCAINYHLSQEA